MYADLNLATAAEHRAALLREACADHLLRLATCCRPGALRRRAIAVLEWLRADYLGPLCTRTTR